MGQYSIHDELDLDTETVYPTSMLVSFYGYNLDLPVQWVKPVEKYTEHKLTKGSTEWKDVETDFFKTLSRSNAAVLEVG